VKRRGTVRRWTGLLPLLLAQSCLLPSFSRDESAGGGRSNAGGAAGASARGGGGGRAPTGAGGTGGAAGSAEGGAGAASASGGEGAAGDAGAAGSGGEVKLTPREYWMDQGAELERGAVDGLLAEDRAAGWIRVAGEAPRGSDASSTRLAKYDADFEIEADGEFRFEPVDAFFGVYDVLYQAENAAGERASGTLRVYVRPATVEFATVADGIGGFAVTGLRDEGFGSAVSGAGDVDADGFGDFVIGAPEADDAAGAVYLVFGGPASRPFGVELEAEAGAGYVRISGRAGDRFGISVAGVGDVNGDERADVLIGAPGAELEDGAAFLIYGRSRASFGTAAELDALLADGGGRELAGAPGDNAGSLVAGGADLTGDDTPDLVVAAQQGRARFYVVDGSLSDDIELETSADELFLGAGQADRALALATPGNVSGDSAQDLFVGTEKVLALLRGPADEFPDNLGTAYQDSDGVLLPRTSAGMVAVTGAGDFDGDGASELAYCDEALADPCQIVPNDPDSLTAGTLITALASGPAFVAGGGDTSGDVFDDLVFAEPERAYVVYGRSAPGATLALDALGARGFGISGAESLAAVAFGGELDRAARDDSRNHYGDWLIADPGAANGAGRVYVVFGEPYSE
jgi:hypothetical protein